LIRIHLITEGAGSRHFGDPTSQEAAERVQQLINEAAGEYARDGRSRQIVTFVGKVPGMVSESLPRPPHSTTQGLDVDALAVAGIIDRAVRLFEHPSLASLTLVPGESSHVINTATVGGRRFEIVIREAK
jgi:hypothetical protein